MGQPLQGVSCAVYRFSLYFAISMKKLSKTLSILVSAVAHWYALTNYLILPICTLARRLAVQSKFAKISSSEFDHPLYSISFENIKLQRFSDLF